MLALKLLLCGIIGYIIGNVQTSILISRARHDDIRSHGSGNAGSTNMIRVYGLKYGLLTFLCDFGKAFVVVAIAKWIVPLIPALGAVVDDNMGVYLAGIMVVLGHNFPVLFGFKGGKGVATSFGAVWAVFGMVNGDWIVPALTTFFGIGLVIVTGIVSIGSLAGAVTEFISVLIVSASRPGADAGAIMFAFFLFGLLFLRHTENIVRLLHGEEKKVFKSRKDKERDAQEKAAQEKNGEESKEP